jgi:NTP pyrophosphatase (non-canonical NTP hydrolase)
MKGNKSVTAVFDELRRAEALHPYWPKDYIHGVAIVAEEAGEAVKAALEYVYEGGKLEELRKELTQTGAMALRMLIDLEDK